MASLDQHSSATFFRILYCGASGTGKTGSLVSLVRDYDLRILDFDNGLDALVAEVKAQFPDRLSSIQYESIRDKYEATPLGFTVKMPRAFSKAAQFLDKWSDGTKPADWGPKKVLVIDSLTNLGKAAYEWARAQNPAVKDPRIWYKGGQDVLDNVIAAITDENFKTNVLVLTHFDLPKENDGLQKLFASALGRALGPKLPRYFNTMIAAETSIMGKEVKRRIRTIPTELMDLKTPNPRKIEASYDLNTGLLQIVRGLTA